MKLEGKTGYKITHILQLNMAEDWKKIYREESFNEGMGV